MTGKLEFWSGLRDAQLSGEPSGAHGVDLLETEIERACLAAATGDIAVRDEALRGIASAGAAAAVGSVRRVGSVEVPLAGGSSSFPASGVGFTIGVWLLAHGVAQALRDAAALSALSGSALIEDLGWKAPQWTAVARAVLAPGVDASAAARRALYLAEDAIDRDHLALEVGPLLDLAEAVGLRRQDEFDNALAAAVRAYDERYSAEDRRRSSLSHLALPVLGLAALAHDRGLTVRIESERVPLDLVRGDVRQTLDAVRYHFPPGRLHRSEEVHWFLDLEGFPRAGRTHVLHEADGRLMATYTAQDGPGLPVATVSVEPPPLQQDADPLDDLLDVGELVLAADLLAGRADGEGLPLEQRGAWLSEAADCLADARTRPEPRFLHERGRAAYRAEPGRFDPERLAAVEGAWRDMLREWGAGREAIDPRVQAGISMAALQVQLEPILRAIAADRTGAALRELRPRDADYAKVFVREMVEPARQRYEQMWDAGIGFRHPVDRTRIRIHLTPAGALADDNAMSRPFPGGYRSVANLLVPTRVWAAWQYHSPGNSAGISYDGLVWCDDHWAFFPKPYRLLTAD
ncbi:Imm49 family immunity protein [Streptomyces sp. GQFP]|uniref:Imm49 family immunity protein n=1 Tax=Streptomyces sp. GQFP TaxID=2907545 RepID=UPI001F31404B|nr:Imm49 family immunity protein [Streptomyces sp. GQFP]UIX34823.1 immunity 49 family protein [Streptomyces sp. GQFP]